MAIEGDIFQFRYSDEERSKRFMPDHCFDGQLVAVGNGDGVILYDTFWLYEFEPRGDARCFTEVDAENLGSLSFVCNLNEVEKVSRESETQYFDPSDVFDLSYHHRFRSYYAVRKGATRSKAKMADVLHQKIQKERDDISLAVSRIEWLSKSLLKVEEGRLEEVYL